jgi:hypothetical protein
MQTSSLREVELVQPHLKKWRAGEEAGQRNGKKEGIDFSFLAFDRILCQNLSINSAWGG